MLLQEQIIFFKELTPPLPPTIENGCITQNGRVALLVCVSIHLRINTVFRYIYINIKTLYNFTIKWTFWIQILSYPYKQRYLHIHTNNNFTTKARKQSKINGFLRSFWISLLSFPCIKSHEFSNFRAETYVCFFLFD